MQLNKETIMSETNILLALEKTLNSKQNIELRDYDDLKKYRYLNSSITDSSSIEYEQMISETISFIRSRIEMILDEKIDYDISLKVFLKPKNINKQDGITEIDTRPLRIIDDLIDEIALNAITLVFIEPLRTVIPNSNYGNNLEEYESGNFFKPYFTQYKNFASKRFEYLNRNAFNYLSVFDIRKFYDRVNLKVLESILLSHYDGEIPIVNQVIRTFKKLSTDGLPQGPMFSHFFATLLMWDIKMKFKCEFPNFEIINYVDDINVFFNSISPEKAKSIDKDIEVFLTKYLHTKLVISEDSEPLNAEKHQRILISEDNYLSNILLQISAFDDLRKDESNILNAFERDTLSKNIDELYEELVDEINRISKDTIEQTGNEFEKHELSNLLEKTSRFKTYREILLINSREILVEKIKNLVAWDKARVYVGLSQEENIFNGSIFDKSFENYLRAIISVSEALGIGIDDLTKIIKEEIIEKVLWVFEESKYKIEFYNTFSTTFLNMLKEYNDYVLCKKNQMSEVNRFKFVKPYNEKIDDIICALNKSKTLKLIKDHQSQTDGAISPYIKGYLKYLKEENTIDTVEINGFNLFRDKNFNQQLYYAFSHMFGYNNFQHTSISPFDRNMNLLKVYEFRILSILKDQNQLSVVLIDKIIDILNVALLENDSEITDPTIIDTLDLASRKIKDRILLDSIIVAHHYVRDLWKNGARDLPFYTLHNHEHSVELMNILSRVNKASNGIMINYLNKYEFYALIMSLYFHDLGMLFFNYDDLRKISNNDSARKFEIKQLNYLTNELYLFKDGFNRNEKIEKMIQLYNYHRDFRSEYTRKEHHYNTSRFEEINKIVQLDMSAFVKDICFNHGVDEKEMRVTNIYINGEKVDAHKVSKYLRFVDGLDNCKNRVSRTLYNSLLKYVPTEDLDFFTKTHWAKHLLIDRIQYNHIVKKSISKMPKELIDGTKVKKILDIKLIFNELIDIHLQTSKPKKGFLSITEATKTSGYITHSTNAFSKTIFERFIDDYFMWTYFAINDLSKDIESAYGVKLVFGYELGTKKMNHAIVIYEYLQ